MKRNFYLKTDINPELSNSQININNKNLNFIPCLKNNKLFSEINDVNMFYKPDPIIIKEKLEENINNSDLKISKNLFDEFIHKYRITNNQNINNNYNTEKSYEGYIKNPNNQDLKYNLNLFSNKINDYNNGYNVINDNLNSLYEYNNLHRIKKLDLTKKINKCYESEESRYNIDKENFEVKGINSENCIDNNNNYKKIDNIKNCNNNKNISRNSMNISSNHLINYMETDSDNNKYKQFSKLKNFYAKTKNNLINKTSNDIINDSKGEKSLFLKNSHSPIGLPISTKSINNKNIYYNYNLNNTLNTPTKLFEISNPKYIDKSLEKSYIKNHNKINDKDENFDYSNSFKNKIFSNYKYSNYKKILNSKIRIVSRNMDEKLFTDNTNINDFCFSTKNNLNSSQNKNFTENTSNFNTSGISDSETKLVYNEKIIKKIISENKEIEFLKSSLIPNNIISNDTEFYLIKGSQEKKNNENNSLFENIKENSNKIFEGKENSFITQESSSKICPNCSNNNSNKINENNLVNKLDEEKNINFSNPENKVQDGNNLTKEEIKFDNFNIKVENKSSKDSSQKDFVISDSNNEIEEEMEISANFTSGKNSHSHLTKINSENYSLKHLINENLKENSNNNSKKNLNIKNNNNINMNNNQDSRMTILNVTEIKKNSRKKIDYENLKEGKQGNLNEMSNEDKIKIENIIRNIDENNRNQISPEKNIETQEDKKNLNKNCSRNNIQSKISNNFSNFQIFKEVNIFNLFKNISFYYNSLG